jgi:Icc protein
MNAISAIIGHDMNQIAWLTDIHLEFLTPDGIDEFCQMLAGASADVILVGGDTSTATTLKQHMTRLAEQWQRPVYFVLGNHDCYGGSIAHVRALATDLTQSSPWLHWLNISGVVELTPNTGLIGHDGWADGRLGNGVRSQVILNDYFRIQEFRGLSQPEYFAKLNALGDEAADYLAQTLPRALRRFQRLLLLTHVPPFRESCWHEGRISDDEFLPHFACQAAGDVLTDVMQAHPDRHLTVLCGHTHGQGETLILPNLLVKTGGAEYGRPQLQALMSIE